jgi:hypothetical protein
MFRKILLPVLLSVIVYCGCSKKSNNPGGGGGNPPANPIDTNTGKPNNEHISVLTQHNDNTRAGLNNKETVLTTSNVNTAQFGRLFTLTVDDQVYAQPLVYAGLSIASGTHNVVFIATVNNSVYAYDGDKGKLYWSKNYTESGMRPPLGSDMNSNWCNPYTDFTSSIGIAGTPVIDSVSKTMYFVARSTNGATFEQYLHAIDITTGAEHAGSPVKIQASVPGTGDGSSNGVVSFDPRRNNQRQGLVLVNGVVYISWASHCDWNPYHGWVLGYDAKTLQQKTVYNVTPNGEAGGIWESGMGIAADNQGSLYVVTGNGTVGQGGFTASDNGTNDITSNPNPSDLTERGESAIKLTPSGSTMLVSSFFTPTNFYNLNINDRDYGVMGSFLIPGTNLYLTGCKDGNIYLLNKDNMGGYSFTANMVVQTIPLNDNFHCQPTYYKGPTNQYVYIWSENDQLRAYPFNGSILATNPATSSVAGPVGPAGADMSVSSNGAAAGTGILWVAYGNNGDAGGSVGTGILRAFDANDITKELWNSGLKSNDGLGYYAKFCSPTVVNGHVYMATFSNQVVVYGLK